MVLAVNERLTASKGETQVENKRNLQKRKLLKRKLLRRKLLKRKLGRAACPR
jgi:hypothetical protein